MLAVDHILVERGLPEELRNAILCHLLPKQAPQLSCFGDAVAMISARGESLRVRPGGDSAWTTLPIPNGERILSGAVGSQHMVFLTTNGLLLGRGVNASGQLASGGDTERFDTLRLIDTAGAPRHVGCKWRVGARSHW